MTPFINTMYLPKQDIFPRMPVVARRIDDIGFAETPITLALICFKAGKFE